MDAALLLALVTTVAGARLKMLSDAFAFEFGSSRGSREKDTQLADFRQALIDVGKDSRQAATEQQQQSAGIAQQAIKVTDQVVAAGVEAVAAGATAAQNLVASVLRRDFVGDLIEGQIQRAGLCFVRRPGSDARAPAGLCGRSARAMRRLRKERAVRGGRRRRATCRGER